MSIEAVFAFLFGAVWGSFLNVCIYRLPKELSIVRPRSFCPQCKVMITAKDNIPILSFLLLKGKCRKCGMKISWRYPLVELLTGLVFFVLYLKFGLTLDFFKFVFFFCMLIVVSFIDIDYHAIPGSLCFIGIIAGMLFTIPPTLAALRGTQDELTRLPFAVAGRGLIIGFGVAYLFKFFGDILITVYLSWRKKESIEGETESLGLGDVDFLGMAGVFLGWQLAVLVFFLAPFVAVGYAVIAFIFKKSHLIPYLPYLSAAALIAFFWGGAIIRFIFLGH